MSQGRRRAQPGAEAKRAAGARASAERAGGVEAEVRANILAQKVGDGTAADLDLPPEFVSRLVDRVLRTSFYEHFRAVVADGPGAAAGSSRENRGTPETTGADADWASLPEVAPALASFRSPVSDGFAAAARRLAPAKDSAGDEWVAGARALVRRHLARDGLLPTLAKALAAALGNRLDARGAPLLDVLADVGVPVDLLEYFEIRGCPPGAAAAVDWIAQRLGGGERLERMIKSLQSAVFTPRPSLEGFRPTSESGLDDVGLVRAQATRATHFDGPGDGGCLDVLQGVLRALPECRMIVTTARTHAGELAGALGSSAGRVSVAAQGLAVSQWAGDSAKGGSIDANGRRSPAQLASRYAARREDATVFVPGDDLAIVGVERTGIRTARSPLVFEGGNLLVCDDPPPAGPGRVLLISEAEVHRNRALGLSRPQVLAMFAAEFGAAECVVLPAASYHIDQEVTVRSMPGSRPRAFVPDVPAAATLIVTAALGALAESSRWPKSLAEGAAAALVAGRIAESLSLIWSALSGERTADGAWPLAYANLLSTGRADSGVGNLHRFLLALDHLAAEAGEPDRLADANLAAIVRTYSRRAKDRAQIRSLLQRLGWGVVAVPSIPEDSRGINALNGVHTRGKYLMPAYGGLYRCLDDAAATAFRASFGPSVEVVPVPSGESQRREGAVHCSIGVFPVAPS